MEQKTVQMMDFKKELKKRERKEKLDKAFNKIKDGVDWIVEHKEAVVVATGALATVGNLVGKTARYIDKKRDLSRLEQLKNQIYDPSTKQYLRLKKGGLTIDQALELERRYDHGRGEGKVEILKSMGVLKEVTR